MTAKHTPGPWIVTDGGGVIADGSMVAVTCSAGGRHADAGEWAQSAESAWAADANASLIAAAPMLLEAARLTVEAIEANPYLDDDARMGVYRAKLRAAIAAAEGD